MSDEMFLAWGADIEWCLIRLRWPVACCCALLALVLTEGL